MDRKTLQEMYDRFRGEVDSLFIESSKPFPSNIPLSFTNLSGVFTIGSHGEDCLPLNRFLKKLKKESPIKKSRTEDADEQIDFDDPSLQRPFQLLFECLEEENLKKLNTIWNMDKITEKQLLVGIGVHLIKKLTGEAYTTEDKAREACPCGCSGKVDTTAMCIGDSEIWHGELDLLAGNEAAAIQVNTAKIDEEEESEDQELVDSPGNRTNIEMEKGCSYRGQGLCQIVGQAIVFAWTECNRHPEMSPLIPSILIMHEDFTFFIYNPKTDELFSARELTKLRPDEKSPDKYAGIVLMWILLNHRLFLRPRLNIKKHIECGFSKSDISKYSLINGFFKKIEPMKNPYEFVISGRRGLLQRDNLE